MTKTTIKKPTETQRQTPNKAESQYNQQRSNSNEDVDVMEKEEQEENKSKKNALLDKMFLDMLKDIYWAEQHLIPHLEEMEKNATTEELKDAIEDHTLQTKKHVSRLEKVFKSMGEEAKAKKCEAMEGLTKEAKTMMNETKEGTMTRDAALIIAAQKVEHYEIASYGSLVQIARTIGRDKEADILEQTLWEEEDTDKTLTEIAETFVNPMADEE